jgi:L,D-transpeptidase-like protein
VVTMRIGTEPTTIAKLMTPTAALSEPGGGRVVARLDTSIRRGGGPTQLLVLDRRHLADREWLRVLLPVRPNDASGWIEASAARLITSSWRIVISTQRRSVDVFSLDRKVRSFRAVVGAPGTPTPHGTFAISERISLADPHNFYGSWILTLTAHSRVLDTFEGGDGRVAIHGRGGSSRRDPLGSARSHGCIRLENAAIDWLAEIAQPGTPVAID